MFTPVQTSIGALLLHQATSCLLFHNGRVLGVSSILAHPGARNIPILLGMVSSVLPVLFVAPSLLPNYSDSPLLRDNLAVSIALGLLIGWGTANGRGCTSGHMLCGLSRTSARSLIATSIFFTIALLTVTLFNQDGIPYCLDRPCYAVSLPSLRDGCFALSALTAAVSVNLSVPNVLKANSTSESIVGFLAGLQFGLGLLVSGMADPAKVLGFFSWRDLRRFDPSLALVVLFGIGPNLGLNFWRGFYQPPSLVSRFQISTATVADIDWRFLVGAAAFGAGWGLSGVCPGPAVMRAVLDPLAGLPWMVGFFIGSQF